MPSRCLPPPWSVEDIGAVFVVLFPSMRLNFLDSVMGKLAFALAVAVSILPSTGHAQEREDMTQVTCTNYLIMAPDMARTFSAWLSGWYNQKFGYTAVGLDDYGKRVASLRQWCTDNPQATVMAALDRSVPQPGPPTGQDKVDMALVTCKQYLTSGAERQDMIAYWMSGYVQASVNQPKFYFRQFATDKRTVAKYCKKHGPETVMSAIQSGVR
jgi:HdeA/HdeB family